MTPTAAAGLDVEALRALYPALSQRVDGKRLVYLDNACTALKSAAVAERVREFYLHWGGCGGKRSTHLLAQQVEDWLGQARGAAASFLHAENPNEIVFTSGTTEAVNLVARAFPYDERREVVITDLEHNSVFLPFYEASRRGEIELKVCPSKDGQVDLSALESLVSEKTALVAMTRASNVMGGIQPIAEAARIAHRKGALILADEAQYLSSHREDVGAVNVDFAAFSGHKLGGPFGSGVLYGKEILLNRLGRYKVGGGTVKSVAWDGRGAPEAVFLDAPMRHEAGVPNFGGALGLHEALRVLQAQPQAAVRAHIAGLVERAALGVAKFSQLRLLGTPERLKEGSLVSFYPVHPEFSITDFNLYLNHELEGHFIAVRAGEHCAHLLHQKLKIEGSVRLSFFAYNTKEEVDLFLAALGGYIREACA